MQEYGWLNWNDFPAMAEIVDESISRASTMLRDVGALRDAILGADDAG